jgi:DNA-binding MarR family transcriptional regulator
MARRSAAHSQAAREAWRALFDTFMLTHPERQATLGEHGLTPNDSRALNSLDRKDGRALGTLARQWNCDPSTATWVVDRLERAGLAERRPSPTDRRVKLVLLTAKGEKLLKTIDRAFFEPPAALDALSGEELAPLTATLSKIKAAHRAPE